MTQTMSVLTVSVEKDTAATDTAGQFGVAGSSSNGGGGGGCHSR